MQGSMHRDPWLQLELNCAMLNFDCRLCAAEPRFNTMRPCLHHNIPSSCPGAGEINELGMVPSIKKTRLDIKHCQGLTGICTKNRI